MDQVLVRVDQNLGNKVRLNVRYNWHDSFNANIGNAAIPVTAVTQPRMNKNWLVSYTHTLRPNLLQRLPDRLPPHRLRHAESVLRERAVGRRDRRSASPGSTATPGTTIPGSRASTSATSAGSAAGGTNWFQFDTTFQVSNVLAYNRGSHNVRAGFDLRRMAPAGVRPTTRAGASTSPATSPATRSPTSCSGCRAR